jgi:hypothetical protein
MNKETAILLVLLLVFALGMLTDETTVGTNTSYPSSTSTTVYVDPQNSTGAVGRSFMVNVSVSNVTDLFGWEFTLEWNPMLLHVVNVREGSFLTRGGSTYFPDPQINNTVGYVTADCSLLGNIPGVNGSGTLATLEFFVETIGECALNLTSTMLVNSAEALIAHSTVDGYCYTHVGGVGGGGRMPYLR